MVTCVSVSLVTLANLSRRLVCKDLLPLSTVKESREFNNKKRDSYRIRCVVQQQQVRIIF